MTESPPPPATAGAALLAEVSAEIGRVFVGAPDTVELLLTALLARGHVLLEGVPGVAKTTLVKSFARLLSCSFSRIQFTPDLLPADITGTYVLDVKQGVFALRRGPVFAQVVLGDEINRAPAKTQSALLEAMQEQQVTIEGETLALDRPFMVLATQNPVEHEGTYPLPEAQLDRFLCKVAIGYPDQDDERRVLATYNRAPAPPRALLPAEQVLRLQQAADEVHVEDELIEYIVALARHTRASRHVVLGASPRAALHLLWAAKARALLRGRSFALPDDVRALAATVLAHRVRIGPEAELDGVRAETVVGEALAQVPVYREGAQGGGPRAAGR